MYPMFFSRILSIFFSLIFSLCGIAQKTAAKSVYDAMASKDTVVINKQLQTIELLSKISDKAYAGTLYMKKASLKKTPAEKLKLFKKGKPMLEDAISKEPGNVEFRFLRLMIQENVPAIVKYKNNISEDAQLIRNNFSTLTPDLKIAIKDYSKVSKVLKPEEFKD